MSNVARRGQRATFVAAYSAPPLTEMSRQRRIDRDLGGIAVPPDPGMGGFRLAQLGEIMPLVAAGHRHLDDTRGHELIITRNASRTNSPDFPRLLLLGSAGNRR